MREAAEAPPVDEAIESTGGASASGGTSKSKQADVIPYQPQLPSLDQLPKALIDQPIWCCYRYDFSNGSKPKKPPISPKNGGRTTGWRSPEFYVDAATALAYAAKYRHPGIGLQVPKGWIALDLDHHRKPQTGELSEAARGILTDLWQQGPVYLETSPGLDGLHVLAPGTVDRTHNDHARGVEVYGPGEFLTITGRQLPGSCIEPVDHGDLSALTRRWLHREEPQGADCPADSASTDSAAEPPCGLDQLQLSDWTRQLIRKGIAKPEHGESGVDTYDGDRSRALYGVIRDLIKAGASDRTVLELLSDPDNGISRAALERSSGDVDGAQAWLAPQIDKLRAELAREPSAADAFADLEGQPLPSNERPAEAAKGRDPAKRAKLVRIDDLLTATIEPIPCTVEAILPIGMVTLLSAHGGTGKSYVTLSLAAHVACGRSWCGLTTRQGPVMYLSAEDDSRALRWRLRAICQVEGIDPTELKALRLLDITGLLDTTLFAETARHRGEPTDLYSDLARYAKQLQPALIVLDTAADVFGADENERTLVRQFLRAMGKLGRAANAAVLINAHVNKSGARSGGTESYSGSTAWHNSVRSRLELERDGEDQLKLTHAKANHGPKIEPIKLRWRQHAPTYAAADPAAYARDEAERRAADEAMRSTIVELIRKRSTEGGHVYAAEAGSHTAHTSLRNYPAYPEGLDAERLKTVLRELQDDGRLEIRSYRGSNSRRVQYWAATDRDDTAEAA